MAVVGTHWPDLEPRQGAFQWDNTDRLVAWAQENSLRVCMGPLVQMDINGDVLAEELFKAYLKQVLVDGVFHADPHPGNVFLTDDGRVA